MNIVYGIGEGGAVAVGGVDEDIGGTGRWEDIDGLLGSEIEDIL